MADSSGSVLLGGAGDDLVVDVGDVHGEGDVEPTPDQIPTDDVELDRAATVTHVRVVVHGRPADVHRHLPLASGNEVDLLVGQGVVEPQHAVGRVPGGSASWRELTGGVAQRATGGAWSCVGKGDGSERSGERSPDQGRETIATAQAAMASLRPTAPTPSPNLGRRVTSGPSAPSRAAPAKAAVRRSRMAAT